MIRQGKHLALSGPVSDEGEQNMAETRPSTLDNEILTDPFRGAELHVYEQSRSLPDDWFALYSVCWLAPPEPPTVTSTEGEADFVFVGPEIGLVVMEVKGGRVGRDAEGWYTIDRHGQRHPIKDPVRQAQQAKYHLLRMIKNHSYFKARYVPAIHMVCFPNVARRDLLNLPECPGFLQVSGEDLTSLKEVILNAVSHSYTNIQLARLTIYECRLIADILKPKFEMPGRWSVLARLQGQIIERLTREQENVLAMLESNRMIGLTGPAGSGKTIVALRWACDKANSGERILVLVPSPLLKQYYYAILPKNGLIHVMLHGEVALSKASLGKVIWKIPWDRIIIDECQDMPIEAWDAIEAHLSEFGTGSLLCIYDSNQRLVKRGSFYLPNGLVEVYLNRVIRNTRQIAELAQLFYRDERRYIEIAGPEGIDVQEVTACSLAEIPTAVSKYIRHLVVEHDFSYKDIVVLFGRTGGSILKRPEKMLQRGKLKEVSSALGVSYRQLRSWWSHGLDEPIVACGNVMSFRGLESPVVILAEIDNLLEKELVEACYVGMSRARYILGIVALPGTLNRIKRWRDCGDTMKSNQNTDRKAPENILKKN